MESKFKLKVFSQNNNGGGGTYEALSMVLSTKYPSETYYCMLSISEVCNSLYRESMNTKNKHFSVHDNLLQVTLRQTFIAKKAPW